VDTWRIRIVAQLLLLERRTDGRLTLYINSRRLGDGGLAIYDT